MNNLTIPEIADMLRPSAETIARQLLPGGKRVGIEWHCSGSQSPTGEAIGVVLTGSKQGLCCFFGSNRGGDLIELAKVVLGLDKAGAVSWAKQWLGLPTNERRADPQLIEKRRREAEERRRLSEVLTGTELVRLQTLAGAFEPLDRRARECRGTSFPTRQSSSLRRSPDHRFRRPTMPR